MRTVLAELKIKFFPAIEVWKDQDQTNSHARIRLHLVSPSPQPPTYNVGHVYTLFLQSFNIVWGEGGGTTQFKTDNSAFLKLRVENTENKCTYSSVPRNFVHHCGTRCKACGPLIISWLCGWPMRLPLLINLVELRRIYIQTYFE